MSSRRHSEPRGTDASLAVFVAGPGIQSYGASRGVLVSSIRGSTSRKTARCVLSVLGLQAASHSLFISGPAHVPLQCREPRNSVSFKPR